MKRHKQDMKPKGESGNVIFIIVIALGLLASMTFSVLQGQGGKYSLDDEKLRIQVNQMMSYAIEHEDGVNRLLTHQGCDITEVSVDHPDRTNYDTNDFYKNTNSPSDLSCHLYDQNGTTASGGGLKWQDLPEISIDAGATEYSIYRNIGISDLGVSSGDAGIDLVLSTYVTEDACLLINSIVGIDNPSNAPPVATTGVFANPPGPSKSFPYFVGGNVDGFASGPYFGVVRAVEVRGFKTGCFETDSNSKFNFYYVILVR